MTDHPRLYPGHRHSWAECTCPNSDMRQCIHGDVYGPCTSEWCGGVCEYEGLCNCAMHDLNPDHDSLTAQPELVRCTVCGFTAPRSLANLDGAMLNDAVYDEPDPYDNPVYVQGHSHSEPICAWPDCRTYLTREQMQAMTDIRCPHHTPTGQCLDHQGHTGDHQYPAAQS